MVFTRQQWSSSARRLRAPCLRRRARAASPHGVRALRERPVRRARVTHLGRRALQFFGRPFRFHGVPRNRRLRGSVRDERDARAVVRRRFTRRHSLWKLRRISRRHVDAFVFRVVGLEGKSRRRIERERERDRAARFVGEREREIRVTAGRDLRARRNERDLELALRVDRFFVGLRIRNLTRGLHQRRSEIEFETDARIFLRLRRIGHGARVGIRIVGFGRRLRIVRRVLRFGRLLRLPAAREEK